MGVYRGESGYYIVDFWFRGLRIKRSTKQRNRQVAVQIESALRTDLARGEYSFRTPRRQGRCTGFIRFMKKEFLPWYKAAHPGRDSTYKRYVVSSKPLARFFGKFRLDDVKSTDVEKFKLARLEEISPAGANRDLAALRSMLNFAIRQGHIVRNPVQGVKFLPEGGGAARVVSFEEERQYLRAANALLRDVATLIVETGMRPKEVFSIRKENVHLDVRYVHVPEGKTRFAKRDIPLTDAAVRVLKRRLEKARGSYLFWHKSDVNRPLTTVQKAHEDAISKTKPRPPFRLYDWRHTFGSRAAMAGVDLPTLKELMGHSSISVTMRYVHPTPEHKIGAIQKLEHFNVQQVFTAYEALRIPTEIPTGGNSRGVGKCS